MSREGCRCETSFVYNSTINRQTLEKGLKACLFAIREPLKTLINTIPRLRYKFLKCDVSFMEQNCAINRKFIF